MNFKEYIGQYEKAENSSLEKFPAFFTRLKLARALLNGEKGLDNNRDLSAPHYLSDLGVRRLKDPSLYAQFISQEFNTKLPTIEEMVEEMNSIPIELLKYWFDITVLLTGQYQSIYKVVLDRFDEIIESNDYRLMLYSGTILSSCEDKKYHQMFSSAFSINGLDWEDKLVLKHRIAVSDLKRDEDLVGFQKGIESILSEYDMSHSEKYWLIIGLVNNLYGLFLVKNKADKTILELTMVNADSILNAAMNSAHDVKRADMILRYLGQVAINRAQIYMQLNKLERGISILKKGLQRDIEKNSLYAGEMYAGLLVLDYQGGHYSEALSFGQKALELYREVGNVTAMKEIYKLLILVYNKLGLKNDVTKLVNDLEEQKRELFI